MLFKSCGQTKEAGGYIVKTTGLDLIKVRLGQDLAGNACSRCIQMGSSPSAPLRKQKTTLMGGLFFSGGDYGTRTCDLMRVKHAL